MTEFESRLQRQGWQQVRLRGGLKDVCYWVKGTTVCRVAEHFDPPVYFFRHRQIWISTFERVVNRETVDTEAGRAVTR